VFELSADVLNPIVRLSYLNKWVAAVIELITRVSRKHFTNFVRHRSIIDDDEFDAEQSLHLEPFNDLTWLRISSKHR
jgi:hypothetical protein